MTLQKNQLEWTLQISVTVVTKNTRQQIGVRRKPRQLVVTTAITTRKR